MFRGRNVVVSGGSRGIGRAIVEELAAQGANVVFVYRSSEDLAHQLLELLTREHPGQKFFARRCDVSDSQAVARFADEVVAKLERIDVLVNCAGITRDAPIVSMTQEQWQDVIATNLSGAFHLTQRLVFDMMKQRAGCVINVSSVSGIAGNAGQTNYSSAKAGLIGFTKALAKEVGRSGVRVNVVAPGFIDTDMTSALGGEQLKKLTGNITLRRIGTSTEVAKAVAFLASDAASYITGAVLPVDGGIVL